MQFLPSSEKLKRERVELDTNHTVTLPTRNRIPAYAPTEGYAPLPRLTLPKGHDNPARKDPKGPCSAAATLIFPRKKHRKPHPLGTQRWTKECEIIKNKTYHRGPSNSGASNFCSRSEPLKAAKQSLYTSKLHNTIVMQSISHPESNHIQR